MVCSTLAVGTTTSGATTVFDGAGATIVTNTLATAVRPSRVRTQAVMMCRPAGTGVTSAQVAPERLARPTRRPSA